jgi:glycosyltransferase involved in cell wall biosynthesis
MNVLQVIHGYPPRYNAGSEIYTQTISRELVRRGHAVQVFTREEDPFRLDYAMRVDGDPEEPAIRLHVINMPRSRDRYRHPSVDRRFEEVAKGFRPDVVHIGHLNHLSTSIVQSAKDVGLPLVFTLHDFWLMCPRGQFIQYNMGGPEPWALCDGQDDRKCAVQCYSRNFGGSSNDEALEVDYWTDWVRRRMSHVREMASLIDVFVAPSRTLLNKFSHDFGIPNDRLVYLDYGFERDRLYGRSRKKERSFVFGYIGTHRPAKGIQVLLGAFPRVRGAAILRIWGRTASDTTPSLQEQARRLPSEARARIEWMGEYGTSTIVADVFDRIDALVVPSIWFENSPLVIHEAQQARVPVITSDLGGMAEYVHHEENGLLFRARDSGSLAAEMQRFADDPVLARKLGQRGYLYSPDKHVPSVKDHVDQILSLYRRAGAHGS